MLLPVPPSWDQFLEPEADHNESCGQNSVASALVVLGKLPDTPAAPVTVDSFVRSRWNVSGGTDDYMLVAALANWGVTATSGSGPLPDAALGRGHYAVTLVGSNSAAHPEPPASATTGHWVLAYGLDAADYHIVNSGTGLAETYSAEYFASCCRGDVIEIMAAAPGAVAQEVVSTVTDNDIARLAIYAVRAALLGEGPGTASEGANIEANVAAVVSSPEAGLSALIAECQNDPRDTPARVAKLEAWAQEFAAAVQQQLAAASAPAPVAPAPAPAADTSALEASVASLASELAALTARINAAKLEI